MAVLSQQQFFRSNQRTIYKLFPMRIINNGSIELTKVSAFQKGWKSVQNYTDKLDDILYDKTKTFISFCWQFGIIENQYHIVFSDILLNCTKNFYFNYIGFDKIWYEIYWFINNHFNININHLQYWTDWTTTMFV